MSFVDLFFPFFPTKKNTLRERDLLHFNTPTTIVFEKETKRNFTKRKTTIRR